ncbi:Uncharacterised protein [Klebsiella pneumoniae]|nr:Uncharacterised protein [Klebsiella pneumoniae]
MPQDACHAKSSTKLLKLNNRIVLAHIADSKRHDADDSNIVQGLAFNRFAVFGNQRLSSQRGKFRPATVLDQNLTDAPRDKCETKSAIFGIESRFNIWK